MSSGIEALYLHVPFCARKCLYCDFASRACDPSDATIPRYANALRQQLTSLGSYGLLDGVTTAYVGGGTPTLLGGKTLSSLVVEIRRRCSRIVELTCEANPDSLSADVLAMLRDAGATRISIGVQSLADDELKELGRIHDAATARRSVAEAVGSGLDVSVDLMCAIPLQSASSWHRTLKDAIDLGPHHVSVYPLAIEDQTPFGRRYGDADATWNDEDLQAERMEEAAGMLAAAGYARYEVASYAREGKECLHNQAYWTGASYLGVGHAAASMLERDCYADLQAACPQLPAVDDDVSRVRMVATSPIEDYLRGGTTRAMSFDLEFLTSRQAMAEDLMLGMRLSRGVGAPLSESCPVDVWEDLVRRGLVSRTKDRYAPTHRGWLLGNELYGRLWELADGSVRTASCGAL